MEFTAQCARSVRLITGQEQEGEIPAAVEYRRKHGNGYLPLYLVPDGELAQSGAVGVKLLQGLSLIHIWTFRSSAICGCRKRMNSR